MIILKIFDIHFHLRLINICNSQIQQHIIIFQKQTFIDKIFHWNISVHRQITIFGQLISFDCQLFELLMMSASRIVPNENFIEILSFEVNFSVCHSEIPEIRLLAVQEKSV